MTEIKFITSKDELKQAIREVLSEPSHTTRKKPYSRKEIRDLFGVTFPTVASWSKKGLIERVEIGGRVFYTAESVNNLLNK